MLGAVIGFTALVQPESIIKVYERRIPAGFFTDEPKSAIPNCTPWQTYILLSAHKVGKRLSQIDYAAEIHVATILIDRPYVNQ